MPSDYLSRQKVYASSILKYTLNNNLNLRTFTETSNGQKQLRIWIFNNYGVPNTFLIADFLLSHGKIYYSKKENECGGLLNTLKINLSEKSRDWIMPSWGNQ